MRTDGSARLTALGRSTRELAKALGVNHVTVSRWLKGEKRPTADTALEIERKLGIPAMAWSRKPSTTATTKPTPPATTKRTTSSPSSRSSRTTPLETDLEQLRELAAQLRAQRSECDIAPDVLAKIASVEARTLAEIDRRRTVHEKIVNSAEFLDMADRIRDALCPHPTGFYDVLEAILGSTDGDAGIEDARRERERVLGQHPELVAGVETAERALREAIGKAAGR